ncbi:MAG TPA: EI24 domain-containing protein [Stellaceae bacterium]|nr:EI24 domain-containing protein [Stellaceae bacterium]
MPPTTSSPFAAATSALVRAITQLPEPEMRRPMIRSLLLTIAVIVVLWLIIATVLSSSLADNAYLRWAIRVAGVLATPVLTWLLFPSITTGILGFYAESIMAAVEHRHYPEQSPPPETRWGDQIRSLLTLMGLGILLNIAVLPLYLFFPGANWVLFILMNGYLFGRSFFDLVMLRRLDWKTTRRMWPQYRGAFFLMGALLAGLFSIPLANLLAPVIGTAAGVHLAESYRPRHRLDRNIGN